MTYQCWRCAGIQALCTILLLLQSTAWTHRYHDIPLLLLCYCTGSMHARTAFVWLLLCWCTGSIYVHFCGSRSLLPGTWYHMHQCLLVLTGIMTYPCWCCAGVHALCTCCFCCRLLLLVRTDIMTYRCCCCLYYCCTGSMYVLLSLQSTAPCTYREHDTPYIGAAATVPLYRLNVRIILLLLISSACHHSDHDIPRAAAGLLYMLDIRSAFVVSYQVYSTTWYIVHCLYSLRSWYAGNILLLNHTRRARTDVDRAIDRAF